MLCKPDLGPCATDNDCQNDSYCDDELLHCIPYDPGATGDMCSAAQQPGIFRVSVQCEWSGPPDDDPYPSSADVSVKPLVADFRIGAQPDDPAAPSIVIVSN
ncbi:MAG: hypothetical protein KC636_36485, partial [Myxococcales bacterium]|nr:hypothetical protein [Myxococcales bacterium]